MAMLMKKMLVNPIPTEPSPRFTNRKNSISKRIVASDARIDKPELINT